VNNRHDQIEMVGVRLRLLDRICKIHHSLVWHEENVDTSTGHGIARVFDVSLTSSTEPSIPRYQEHDHDEAYFRGF
jgi:hypothetical protein